MKNIRIWDKNTKKYRRDILLNSMGEIQFPNDTEKDNLIVEESLGHYDKNGAEIFCGDYVEGKNGIWKCCAFRDRETIFRAEALELKPLNNRYCYGMGFISPNKDIEVVSNIHDPRSIDLEAEKANKVTILWLKALEVLEFHLKKVAENEAEKLFEKLKNMHSFKMLFQKPELKKLKAMGPKRWLEADMFDRKHILQFLFKESVYALSRYNHFYCSEFETVKRCDPITWFSNKVFIEDKDKMRLIKRYSDQYTEEIQKFNNVNSGTVSCWGEKT